MASVPGLCGDVVLFPMAGSGDGFNGCIAIWGPCEQTVAGCGGLCDWFHLRQEAAWFHLTTQHVFHPEGVSAAEAPHSR